MAGENPPIFVDVVVGNPKAVKALLRIMELSAEIANDQPWNAEVRKLKRMAKILKKNLAVQIRR